MVADYHLGPCMLSDVQQLYGTAHTLFLLSFMLFLSVLSLSVSSAALQPFSLCVCSPRGIPLSFCISLSPSVSLHPVSFSSCSLLRRLSTQSAIYLFAVGVFSVSNVCFSFLLQWSHGFYLTHNQGQSGFEFFFKTKELKKKWLEQFGMAMWVCAYFLCIRMWKCDMSDFFHRSASRMSDISNLLSLLQPCCAMSI